MPTDFIPGLQLAGEFYREIVGPLLAKAFPALPYTAGLIDGGSEVLGFDDPTSVDHNWGPRLMLFLSGTDLSQIAGPLHHYLAANLPLEFRGYPTNFSEAQTAGHGGQHLHPIRVGPVNHRITIQTVAGFFLDCLNFDIQQTIEPADWLTFPQQRLQTIAAGAIFHDELGLESVRARFSWYPQDVWLYLMAAAWARIGQEEHLMGRAGMVGDEVGPALIAAGLVREVMQLCFLMEKTYAPYSKWFGSAFKRLSSAGDLWPVLQDTLQADTWQSRQGHLVRAYEFIASRHNTLNLTRPLPEKSTAFHDRPLQVIAVHGFAKALREQIQDPAVKQIAERPLIGGIDLFSDNVDLLSNPFWRTRLKHLYT